MSSSEDSEYSEEGEFDEDVMDRTEENYSDPEDESEDEAAQPELRPLFPDYKNDLLEALEAVSTNLTGLDIAYGGKLPGDFRIPAVVVEGVGRLAFPLCKEQTSTIISRAATKGSKSTRKLWKISAEQEQLKVSDNNWTANLDNLVVNACKKLGVDANELGIHPELKELLLYGENYSFNDVNSVNKGGRSRVFGTLIVQLPAEHTGGDFVVKYGDREKRFPSAARSADDSYFLAFYADCKLTLEPIKTGKRLLLIYNLVVRKSVPIPTLAETAFLTGKENLVKAHLQWVEDSSDMAPKKLGFALTESYERDLSYESLEGEDKAVVDLLAKAGCAEGKPLFDVHLVQNTKRQIGRGFDDYESEHFSVPIHNSDDSIKGLAWLDLDFDSEVLNAENEEEFYAHGSFDETTESSQASYGYPNKLAYYCAAAVVFWPRVNAVPLLLNEEAVAVAYAVMEKRGIKDLVLNRVVSLLQPHGLKALFKFHLNKPAHCPNTLNEFGDIMKNSLSSNAFREFLELEIAKPSAGTKGDYLHVICKLCKAMLDTLPSDCVPNDAIAYTELLHKIIPILPSHFGKAMITIFASKVQPNLEASIRVLKLAHVQEAIKAGDESLRNLRLATYKKLPSDPLPPFTWKQPEASFPGNREVENFLRGPKAVHTIRGFSNIYEARNYVSTHFAWKSDTAHCSFTTMAEGKGEHATVCIRKTKELFNALERERNETLKLRSDLKKLYLSRSASLLAQ